MNRPLCAVTTSRSGKGKLGVLGSIHFLENSYIDKEENMKVIDGLIKWLLGINSADLVKLSTRSTINNRWNFFNKNNGM